MNQGEEYGRIAVAWQALRPEVSGALDRLLNAGPPEPRVSAWRDRYAAAADGMAESLGELDVTLARSSFAELQRIAVELDAAGLLGSILVVGHAAGSPEKASALPLVLFLGAAALTFYLLRRRG